MVKSSDQWLGDNTSELEELPKFTETKSELEVKIKEVDEAAKDADKGGVRSIRNR